MTSDGLANADHDNNLGHLQRKRDMCGSRIRKRCLHRKIHPVRKASLVDLAVGAHRVSCYVATGRKMREPARHLQKKSLMKPNSPQEAPPFCTTHRWARRPALAMRNTRFQVSGHYREPSTSCPDAMFAAESVAMVAGGGPCRAGHLYGG